MYMGAGDTLQMIRNTIPDHGHQHHPHASSMQTLGRYEDSIQAAIRNTMPDHHHGGHHMHNMQSMQNVHLAQNHMQAHMPPHMHPQPQHQANHNAYNDPRQIPMEEVLVHNLGLAFKLPQAESGINPDQPMILEPVEAPVLPDPDDYVNSNQYDAHNFSHTMQFDQMARPPRKPRKKKEKADIPRKKRERHPENWKRNKRKKARDQGQEYLSSRGKVVSAKEFNEDYNCNCRRKCDDRITKEKRKKLFKEYWKIGDWKGQTAYLAKLIVISDVKQRTTSNKEDSRRQKSCSFKLGKQRVCKNMFKNTFQISNARIETAIKKRSDNDEEIVDNRGKHAAHNKTPESTMKLVREHISSMKLVREHLHTFPRYNPHYCGHRPDKHYLEPGLNVSELYNLYLEWCKKKNVDPVKKWLYRSEFDKMNDVTTNSADDKKGGSDGAQGSDTDHYNDDNDDDGDDMLSSSDDDDDNDAESNHSHHSSPAKESPKKAEKSKKGKQKETATKTTKSACKSSVGASNSNNASSSSNRKSSRNNVENVAEPPQRPSCSVAAKEQQERASCEKQQHSQNTSQHSQQHSQQSQNTPQHSQSTQRHSQDNNTQRPSCELERTEQQNQNASHQNGQTTHASTNQATIQTSTIQASTIQASTIQANAIQANAVQASTNQPIPNRPTQPTMSSNLWPNPQQPNSSPFMQVTPMGHGSQGAPNPLVTHQGFFQGYNDPRVPFGQNQGSMILPNLSMATNPNIPNGGHLASDSSKHLGAVLQDPSLNDNNIQGGATAEALKKAEEAKKKRSRNPEEWKRNKRKNLRDCGKEYVSARGKVIPAKTFNADFRCGCKRKCDEKLPVETRKEIFEEFWDIGEWKKQTAYLAKLISITEVQQRTTPLKSESRRQKSCIFKLKDEKVCKNMFRNTFQISGGRIDTVLKKLTDDEEDEWSDNRGKHSPHNKTPDKVLALVREHIISFPRNQSQFVRRKSDKSSQELGLNVAKLYSHYKEWCAVKNEQPVKEWLYRNEFCRLNLLLPPVTEPVSEDEPQVDNGKVDGPNDLQGHHNPGQGHQGHSQGQNQPQGQGHPRLQNDPHSMRPLMEHHHQPQQQQPQRPLDMEDRHLRHLGDDCQNPVTSQISNNQRSHNPHTSHAHSHPHPHLHPQRTPMFDPLRHKSNHHLNGMFDPAARLAYDNELNKSNLYEAERARAAMFQTERRKDPFDPQRHYEMERARMFDRNQGNEIPLFDPEGNKVASFWHSQIMHHNK